MHSDHVVGPSGITVTGIGSAMAAVDRVTATRGVEIVRADAGDAFRVASGRADAVLAVLADHGVDSRSVRTADLSLGPRYEYRGNEQVLTGYQAAQRLIVTLDGLATVDRMLTDVVGRAGEGLRIEQVALTAANPREAESDARAAAMIDAREKATSLAALSGRPLGRVERVSERPDVGPRPVALMAHRAMDSSASMPLATGDTAVTVSLVVQFAWAD
jgi:uncharacterized protein YggE